MKISNRLVAVVAAILVIVAVLFLFRSCGAKDSTDAGVKPSPSATATTPRVPSTSTGYIATKIKERLEVVAKQSLKIECPKRVDLVKGTKMTCKVFAADEPETQLAAAKVTITDRTGKFTWTSEQV